MASAAYHTDDNIESQKLLPKYLIDNTSKLYEFLMRVKYGKLAEHIYNAFQRNGIDTRVYSVYCKVVQSGHTDIYAVVNIIMGSVQIGHITLHLIKGYATKFNGDSGPFHVVNNVYLRRARIRVTKRFTNIGKGIILSVGKHVSGKNIPNDKLQLMNVILDVISEYFNASPSNELSLNNTLIDTDIKDTQIENYVTLIKGSYSRHSTGGKKYRKTMKRRRR